MADAEFLFLFASDRGVVGQAYGAAGAATGTLWVGRNIAAGDANRESIRRRTELGRDRERFRTENGAGGEW
jgi:hypothetical protein